MDGKRLIPFVAPMLPGGLGGADDSGRASGRFAGTVKFDIVTIFPGFFGGPFEHGVVEQGADERVTGNPDSRFATLDVRSASYGR